MWGRLADSARSGNPEATSDFCLRHDPATVVKTPPGGTGMKRALLIVVVLVGLAAIVTPVAAETYPSRPIRLVVPFAPGGPADFLARLVGQKLGEELGQQIVIDNRPGANTIIGAQVVAKADPDGYTLLMAIDGTLVMNPFLYSKLPYDVDKDFVPIALLANVPSVLVANLKVPANS